MSVPFGSPPPAPQREASSGPDLSRILTLVVAGAGAIAYVLGFFDAAAGAEISGNTGFALLAAAVLGALRLLPKAPNTMYAAAPLSAYAALALLQGVIGGLAGGIVVVVLLVALVQFGAVAYLLLVENEVVAPPKQLKSQPSKPGESQSPHPPQRQHGQPHPGKPQPGQPQSGSFPQPPQWGAPAGGQPQQPGGAQPPQPAGGPPPWNPGGQPPQPGSWTPAAGGAPLPGSGGPASSGTGPQPRVQPGGPGPQSGPPSGNTGPQPSVGGSQPGGNQPSGNQAGGNQPGGNPQSGDAPGNSGTSQPGGTQGTRQMPHPGFGE
ncbi:DUF5336 domain-containing protein [Saccharopolyspora erythraea]|uniref:DUF5336 domain-containing protein n=1 Tax=Saccharopolyspora erythraea TaxID=1836 RepID=UPI001BA9CF80|nr:DUF5336 domain-containing protein [Saccharopolyspora erythraea]QUH05051.1 DUF5336 domain-containing protein [Saccharopolyspora erythraea]